MTKQQIETFLTEAGVMFTSPPDAPGIIDFKNRGEYLRAFTYEDGDLLHITCSNYVPEGAPGLDRIREIFQEIEDEYPIVKLILEEDKQHKPTFMVSTEQFEPASAIESVFWRTADLLVRAAADAYHRLQPTPQGSAVGGGRDAWISGLEQALRKGCPPEGLAPEMTDSAVLFAQVKAALALIVTHECSGTGFCVASDAQVSYYITNAHAVPEAGEIWLYRQRPRYEKMVGTLIARGDPNGIDLAVIQVAVAAIPTLKLQATVPRDEMPVGVAGYARVQLEIARQYGELVPAIHLGTVTSVVGGGTGVLHDALSRPGASGGPVFDLADGEVIGVHQAGWTEDEQGYSIGVAKVLIPFLIEHKVLKTA